MTQATPAASSTANTATVTAVLAERGKRYGEFRDHAAVTQRMKAAAQGGRNWREGRMTHDQREAIEMILHKIGRILNGDPDYADSWVDIAGYATLVAQRLEQEQSA